MGNPGGDADAKDGLVASVCAGLMIAHQVAGKATRDALFLSSYAVSDLPLMLIVAAFASLLAMFAGSRLLGRRGPAAVMPLAFATSAVLLFALAFLAPRAPRVAAVVFYLHFAALGAVLISGFWSLINERFDPRSAKRRIGRIAAGGTAGGLLGGLVAERAAALFSAEALLPLLATLHLLCALLLIVLARRTVRRAEAGPADDAPSTARDLARVPLIRNLGALVLVGTVAAAFLDYVFKAEAVERWGNGENLLRFFALFYTAASLLGLILQAGVTRRLLDRLGLARTVAAHSAGVLLGGLLNVVAPGFASATVARGTESGLRNSLFRSGYETLFIPLPPAQKRAAKPWVDVGCERLGDATGGVLIRALLTAGPAAALPLLAVGAGLLGGLGIWITRRVQRGWVRALERSLLDRGAEIDLRDADEATRTMVLRTMQSMELGPLPSPARETVPTVKEEAFDPVTAGLATLRGHDAAAIRRLLERRADLPAEWVPTLVTLLAWDEMSAIIVRALRPVAARHEGQLVDALLNPQTDFAVRRRLPRVLSELPRARVVDGLLGALRDARFEVRYQAGRALLRLKRLDEALPFDRHRVIEALLQEVKVERRVWEGHRLLDEMPPDTDSPFDEDLLRRRSNRSLEHVFTVLSIILPARPLGIAYQGLFTEDPVLRGTALEYLESVLPDELREGLWPFLDEPVRSPRSGEDRQRVLDELLRSHASIQIRLRESGDAQD